MARKYAEGTTVSVDRSILEIRKLLRQFGCDRWGNLEEGGRQVIIFNRNSRTYRLDIPLPDPDDVEFTHTPKGSERTEKQAEEFFGKEVRRRLRALVAVIKAKIVAVENEVTTFEKEFFSHLVVDPQYGTAWDWINPQIEDRIERGESVSGMGLMLALPEPTE